MSDRLTFIFMLYMLCTKVECSVVEFALEVATLADGGVMLSGGGPTRRLLLRTAAKHRKLLCQRHIVCLPLLYSTIQFYKIVTQLKCWLLKRFEAETIRI